MCNTKNAHFSVIIQKKLCYSYEWSQVFWKDKVHWKKKKICSGCWKNRDNWNLYHKKKPWASDLKIRAWKRKTKKHIGWDLKWTFNISLDSTAGNQGAEKQAVFSSEVGLIELYEDNYNQQCPDCLLSVVHLKRSCWSIHPCLGVKRMKSGLDPSDHWVTDRADPDGSPVHNHVKIM